MHTRLVTEFSMRGVFRCLCLEQDASMFRLFPSQLIAFTTPTKAVMLWQERWNNETTVFSDYIASNTAS